MTMTDDTGDQVDPSDGDDTTVQDDTQTPVNDSLDEMDPNNKKHEDAESPAVKGEEDVFSGDTPTEPANIDEEMAKIGEELDPEHPTPLGEE